MFPPGVKRRGGGGVEHLEAVYAWVHTLLAYTRASMTSCCLFVCLFVCLLQKVQERLVVIVCLFVCCRRCKRDGTRASTTGRLPTRLTRSDRNRDRTTFHSLSGK